MIAGFTVAEMSFLTPRRVVFLGLFVDKVTLEPVKSPRSAFSSGLLRVECEETLSFNPILALNDSACLAGYFEEPRATECSYVLLVSAVFDRGPYGLVLVPHSRPGDQWWGIDRR